MSIIVAVAMKTESGDNYLSLFTDIDSPQDFVERVEENMGDELAYVYDVMICTDCCADGEMSQALYERIAEMGDDE